MSDLIALGPSDAEARWIGIRRHQALLAMAGLGLAGVGVLAHHFVGTPRSPSASFSSRSPFR